MLLSVVLVSGLSLFGVTGKITNGPNNTIAEVGGQVTFGCMSDTNLQSWIFSKNREEVDNSSGQNIVINCVVQPGFTTNYDAVRPGGFNNSCTLIVEAITMQQAGVYTCSDIAVGSSAILTVIDRDASITVSSQPETVEGETVTMSYTVNYNTSTASSRTPTIQPQLSWTDSDGNNVTGSLSETANSVTSSISVTAGRQDIQPYTCRTSFEIIWPSPSTGLSFANNTPNSLSNPPNTLTINVLYAPIISSITTSQDVPVCPGKTVNITCNATANPTPTYSWIGPDSRTYSGTTIEALVNGVYTCTASNVIRGSVRSDMKETTLNVSSETNKSCGGPSENDDQGTSMKTVAIVLGVLLAVSLAINIVVVVFIIRGRSCLRNGMKTENASNIGHENNEERNRNETEATSLPAVYLELTPTIYAQLTN